LSAAGQPALSIVIAIASDTTAPTDTRHLAPCLDALMRQGRGLPFEVIVPLPPGVAGLEDLRRRQPDVQFPEIPDLRKYPAKRNSREHHGELIARGFARARGAIIALIEDHDVASPDWIARLFDAHRRPVAGVGGAIENGIDRPLNWAVYFCDFLLYQNPLPEGDSRRASDANVSYKRAALESVRKVWEKEFHEAMVNGAILANGGKLALAPEVIVYQHRQGLQLLAILRERRIWGRSFGAWRCQQAGRLRRVVWAVFSPVLPVLLPLRLTWIAFRKRRNFWPFLKALPITAALTASWSWGEFIGYVTGRAVPNMNRQGD
jgi:hypothetical protein